MDLISIVLCVHNYCSFTFVCLGNHCIFLRNFLSNLFKYVKLSLVYGIIVVSGMELFKFIGHQDLKGVLNLIV